MGRVRGLDIGIPQLDGFSVITRIKALILVLTSQPAGTVCWRYIQLGARGFINKEEGLDKLITAIKAVDQATPSFLHWLLAVSPPTN